MSFNFNTDDEFRIFMKEKFDQRGLQKCATKMEWTTTNLMRKLSIDDGQNNNKRSQITYPEAIFMLDFLGYKLTIEKN